VPLLPDCRFWALCGKKGKRKKGKKRDRHYFNFRGRPKKEEVKGKYCLSPFYIGFDAHLKKLLILLHCITD
jgi:hypothetical protein